MAGTPGAKNFGETSVGQSKPPDWLLACFDNQRKRAIAKYVDFVRAGIGLPTVWAGPKNQMYLGSDGFVESMRGKLSGPKKGDLSEISRLQRRLMAKPLNWYKEKEPDRKKAMAMAFASGDYTMKEIATSFGVHYSTVSRAVRLLERDS